MVFWQAEQEVLNRKSRKSEDLYKKLTGGGEADSRAQYRYCTIRSLCPLPVIIANFFMRLCFLASRIRIHCQRYGFGSGSFPFLIKVLSGLT
jgi:hypothetical protein